MARPASGWLVDLALNLEHAWGSVFDEPPNFVCALHFVSVPGVIQMPSDSSNTHKVRDEHLVLALKYHVRVRHRGVEDNRCK